MPNVTSLALMDIEIYFTLRKTYPFFTLYFQEYFLIRYLRQKSGILFKFYVSKYSGLSYALMSVSVTFALCIVARKPKCWQAYQCVVGLSVE